MITGIIVTLGVVSGILLIFYIVWWIFYRLEIKDLSSFKTVEMKSVRRFKGLYAIAPERYELKDFSIYGPVVRYGGKDDSYFLFFPNPISYFIVRKMLRGDKKKIERKDTFNNRMEAEKGFIQELERDLKEFKEKEKNENGHDK